MYLLITKEDPLVKKIESKIPPSSNFAELELKISPCFYS